MDLGDISRKFDNTISRIKRKPKNVDSYLEEVNEMYEESLESIDEMIKWLDHYTQSPEKVEYDSPISVGVSFETAALNSTVKESPKLVRKPYRRYREEEHLLKGDETKPSMSSSGISNDWTRFCIQAAKHREFLVEIRGLIRQGKKEVEESLEEWKRQDYRRRSDATRGEDTEIDRDAVMPDMTPDTIRNEIADELDERLSEESEDTEEQDMDAKSDSNLMTPRQFIHYLIEYLGEDEGNRSEYYHILKQGFPEQAETIESEIYSLQQIDQIDGDDMIRPLSSEEVKYIRERVNTDKEIKTSLERHKEHS